MTNNEDENPEWYWPTASVDEASPTHKEIDALAYRVEASIANTRRFLNEMPEFKQGRNIRQNDLSQKLRRSK